MTKGVPETVASVALSRISRFVYNQPDISNFTKLNVYSG